MKRDLPLKIFFVMTPPFDPNAGGVQRTTFKLGRFFDEQGLSVSFYSLASTGHVPVGFGRLSFPPNKGGGTKKENLEHLHSQLELVQPDVVINQMPYVSPLREKLFQVKKKQNYLLLGCLRNSLFNFKSNAKDRMRDLLPRSIYWMLNNPLGVQLVLQRHRLKHSSDLRKIIDQNDLFVLLAPPNREELHYFVKDYKADKVISIPNSIPKLFPDASEKEKILLHVGRLNVQQKRSDLLAPLWERVHAALPEWRFVIVGDGPYRSQLEADIRDRKLPRVQFEGFQKPSPYYRKADLFVMPSAYEGFPNTLLEAQSYGCVPLVFDSYAALRWIVNDGEDALLAPPFDLKTMADQLVQLAGDPVRIQTMRKAALDNAGRFTIDQVGRQWMELFEQSVSQ